MIEYMYTEGSAPCSDGPLKVRLDGVPCGEIRRVAGGYAYFPRCGCHVGEVYQTVSAVQRSLQETLT